MHSLILTSWDSTTCTADQASRRPGMILAPSVNEWDRLSLVELAEHLDNTYKRQWLEAADIEYIMNKLNNAA